ncbi:MAG: ATP-binding protein [Gammaproteobacteria bacterium]|nr:ATP-binding protein [Gammaproteobacteria bacterium]
MTLRAQLWVYLLAVQVFPLVIAVYFFRQGEMLWFFVMEAAIVAFVFVGAVMIRRALRPIEFVQASKATFQDREFGTRMKPVGISELDELVGLFNEMLEELHREQLKLGEQKGFFDKLLQATPIGVIIHDFDDCISNVNPAAEHMLGLEFEALKGSRLADHPSCLATAIIEDQQKLPALITLPDGKRFRVQQSVFYDRGFHRKFLMLEELTSEMQAAERSAYEKLIQMTSHEVNNTIGATNSLLQGCTEYCAQLQEQDRADFTHALQVVMERNSRLAEFMQRLAQVVHLPAPDCQPVSLPLLIRNIQAMFAVELRNRNIRWEFVDGGVPSVNLDTHLFEQALINIVKNAFEAIERDGVLTIILQMGSDAPELIVQDSAGVLTQADRQKLFKPFYSTKRHGQGIGLMLVREILQQHGFRYSLDCEPGKWTRFKIKF